MRDEIRTLVTPVVRAFTDQVVELVHAQVELLLEQARTAALAAFVGPRVVDRDAKPAKKPAARRKVRRLRAKPAPVVVEVTPVEKKPRACRLCREVGHRADRCPNVTASIPVADRDVKPDNIASPPPVRNDRFARIEAMARSRRGQAS